jgi:hypothetical protein
MAQPSTRQELIDYCLRSLGAPLLEINVPREQLEDRVDEALQYFQERHFDGVYPCLLKYKITQDDIDRGKATLGGVGISTISATTSIVGTGVTFNYFENSNYIEIPPHIIGINRLFKYNTSALYGVGMYNVQYQFFLNNVQNMSSFDILSYAMMKRYIEDIDFLLNTQKPIRFNQRQDRLYLDLDWNTITVDTFIVIDCYRLLDPNDYPRVWNDSFLKKYLTALIKRQWGQNLIKYVGMKLPGGTELNGRQLFDDATAELKEIQEMMSSTYELPPLDFIG